MSLKSVSKDKLQFLSMIELANLLLMDEKKELELKEIFKKISEIKGFTKEQELDKLAQFYTDLNTDGRFMTLGSNVWTLKRWYPIDEIDDEVKVRHKKKSKQDDDEEEFPDILDDEDDLEKDDEEENEYDEADDADEEFKDIDADIDEKVDDELLDDEEFDDESFEEDDDEEF